MLSIGLVLACFSLLPLAFGIVFCTSQKDGKKSTRVVSAKTLAETTRVQG